MRWLSIIGSWLFSRRIERDLARVWRLVRDNPEFVVLALGVLLRCTTYGENRTFWMDEASLWGNIKGKPILDFSEPLAGDQLAPLGFLIAQRALVRVLGTSRYVARLIPLVSGIVALGLLARLARRTLPRRGALVALILFAISDDLVYYSSEMKPYSLDLAVGLALSLAALGALEMPLSFRRAAAMGIAALVAPWCSFASAFVVAGSGATLILFSLLCRRYRDAAVWVAISTGWGASFTLAYQASQAVLTPYTSMYKFWWFAFLPIWPPSLDHLSRAAGILLEIFVNPLNVVGPTWPWVGVALPLSLVLAGGISLARRSWPAWAILVLPIALAMLASGMKRYPFHGRLILELVPAFFLLIAAGTERLRDLATGRARIGYVTVLVLVLAYPCLASFYQTAWDPPRDFNRHGDLHKNLFIQ
ncbi:MAG: hypothetical protein ACHRXM_06675 [Isosphaerales bacterium]